MNFLAKEFVSAAAVLLSGFVTDPAPWTRMEANSEQRHPIYLGRTARELAFGLPSRGTRSTVLPESLKALAERQVRAVQAGSPDIPKGSRIEFELWPTLNDDGRLTWAIARWRDAPDRPWRWLAADATGRALPGLEVQPELPIAADSRTPAGRSLIFDDVLSLKSLYDKPLFGNCVWTTPEGDRIQAAWLPMNDVDRYRQDLMRSGAGLVCHAVSPPARLDARPVSFVVAMRDDILEWPPEIVWPKTEPLSGREEPQGHPSETKTRALDWPSNYVARYREDIRILSGELEAFFPVSGKTLRFKRKNNAAPDNQLEELVDYLAERYRGLAIETRRQTFLWRGQRQSNLIAVIRGTRPAAENRPVLLADHIDTAFCEDEFKRSGRRVSAPGADDNGAATATLLRAAEILKGLRPRNDVWLVHLTGEEFPADDLGARRLVDELLQKRQDIGGAVILDMIGFRKPGDPVVQINPGDSEASLAMAEEAMLSARRVAPGLLVPELRTRYDPRSYLHNTDGLIFSHAGYPVILINEHINRLENMSRPHYHQTTDLSGTLDWDYAVAVSKTAIETVARLAETAAPALPADALPVPLVRQAASYSCGAAALLSELYYWRTYDGNESSLYSEIETDPKSGTKPQGLVRGAKKYGLDANFKENVSLDELRAALKRGEPVILDIQAWPYGGQASTATWNQRWEDGHYVVLVAIDEENAYFMDPSVAAGYSFIPLPELLERWHDYENMPDGVWRNQRLAVFIRGSDPIQSFPAPVTPTH